jgi:DNA invertase Pin-like site-specific DNA recombinase
MSMQRSRPLSPQEQEVLSEIQADVLNSYASFLDASKRRAEMVRRLVESGISKRAIAQALDVNVSRVRTILTQQMQGGDYGYSDDQ